MDFHASTCGAGSSWSQTYVALEKKQAQMMVWSMAQLAL
jgi:hypothetical protein